MKEGMSACLGEVSIEKSTPGCAKSFRQIGKNQAM
jgi:hypothetical protein